MSIFTDVVLLKQIYIYSLIGPALTAAAIYTAFHIKNKSILKDIAIGENEFTISELIKYPDKNITKPIEPKTFTVFGIFGFLAAFGLSGILLIHDTIIIKVIFLLSILFGITGEVCASMISYAVTVKNDKNIIFAPQTVGLTGVVYENIPASKKGTGSIRVAFNNKVTQIKALSVDEVALTKGTEIKILYAYSDNSVVVERLVK